MSVIKVDNLGKLYRLGTIGTGTLSHDLNRLIARIRGKEDPYLKVGVENDRTTKGNSDYVWALRNITFDVKLGEVFGIIGKNGAGKSTLLKILSRTTTPTTGEFKAKGRIASLLEVGTGFHPELTGRENIFLNGAILGMTKADIKMKFDEIVDFSGVEKYIDTPVKRYSSGMYVRLAFAVAAHLEPDILIVDEVLAVGDAEFQKKCLGKMKDVSGQGRTVLFVSHNMGVMNSLCKRIMLLDKGQINAVSESQNIIRMYMELETNGKDFSSVSFEPNQSKELQVIYAGLKDANGVSLSKKIDVFERVTVEVQYLFKRYFSALHMTLVINNEMGETIAFFDRTDYAGNYFEGGPGLFGAKLNIPSPLLKPGKYFVTIGLQDCHSGINDHKFNIISFEIESVSTFRGDRDGGVFIPIQWELVKVHDNIN